MVEDDEVIEYESKKLTVNEQRSQSGKFVEISYGYVHYELGGPKSGKKVILVPGFTAPLFIWDYTYEVLVNSGFRVLRYDIFGRGFSDRPKTKYTMDFFVDQLYELLVKLGIHDYDLSLVGVSLGGGICVAFADLYSNMIRKLSLIAPIGFPYESSTPLFLRIPLLNKLTVKFFSPDMLIDGEKSDFHQYSNLDEYLEKYKVQFIYEGIMQAIRSTLMNASFTNLKAVYRRVGKRIPIQLFWGEFDQHIPFSTHKKVIDVVPNIEFHPVEGSGHMPQYTHPEVVNPLLKAFLER